MHLPRSWSAIVSRKVGAFLLAGQGRKSGRCDMYGVDRIQRSHSTIPSRCDTIDKMADND